MKIQIYDVELPMDFKEAVREEIDKAMTAAIAEEREELSVKLDFTNNIIIKDFYFRLDDLISFEEDTVPFAGDEIECLKVNIAGMFYKVVKEPNVIEIFKEELK